MRPLVVISKINPASQNIKQSLMRLVQFEQQADGRLSSQFLDMAEYPEEIIHIVPTHPADYYIFASTHKSASNTPALTVHTPGNWGTADLGGEPRKLNVAFGSKVKVIAQAMKRLSSEAGLGWQLAIEADHHGPTIEKPIIFVEIGSTEKEWKDGGAGEIAAKAIIEGATSEAVFPCYVGFGGTHYAPKFAPKIFDGEIAVGHIVSGYALEGDGADEERVRQALQKNVDVLAGVLIDWKGIKKEAKDKLVEALNSIGQNWEKA